MRKMNQDQIKLEYWREKLREFSQTNIDCADCPYHGTHCHDASAILCFREVDELIELIRGR